MKIVKTTIALALITTVLFLCTGCATSDNSLAVKRGQQHVERSLLPLVCLTFGTQKIGMPIDSVSVVDLAANKKYKFIVSKSFGGDRPDYLTAISDETVLCLVTLKLKPGEYLLDAIEYTGGRGDSFNYSFSFSEHKKLQFRVVDGAVNYVGSVEFSANWMPWLITPSPNIVHSSVIERKFPVEIFLKATAARDRKWVHDQIPGMIALPSVLSELQEIK